MTHSCTYRGKKEKCLLSGNRYPITKNNKVSRKRIKSAESYAKRYGDLKKLKKAGLCKLAKRNKIKLKDCSNN